MMQGRLEHRIKEHLRKIEVAGLRRHLFAAQGVDLSSNDYLRLSSHPEVKYRMNQAVTAYGCGSTGSRLLRGHRDCFTKVEERFAKWKGSEKALYFSSGYLANIAVLSTFLEDGDVVFSDELNHASLIDGIRLSRARRVVFAHKDVELLAHLIERESQGKGQKFLVTESLFSMDGDEAPLIDYAALCRATGTNLIVDEAHAVGVYGHRGSGLLEDNGIGDAVFISINAAGKALGVGGAFVAGHEWAIDYLVQCARPFIFSTAPPPAMADAIDAALDCIHNDTRRLNLLHELAIYLRELLNNQGIEVGGGSSQIIPIVIGDTEQSVLVAESLQTLGFDVRAIRPPSVPVGRARLRISVNVGLTREILSQFALALSGVLEKSAYLPV